MSTQDGLAGDRPAEASTRDPSPDPNTTQTEDFPHIVAFGDSLTAGLGVASQDSYPAQLQERLNRLGYHYRVINAGVSGETTAGGVRRVSWILKNRPRLVILELGANDGLRGLTVEQTGANLEEMILTMKQAGVAVVLAGMKLPPNYGADYTSRFEAMYHGLAARHHLAFIPFFLADVGGQADLNQADGIHPTGKGYTLIVENVLKVLEPVLQKLARRGQG
jgi:acyl-CoA thioesterase-1